MGHVISKNLVTDASVVGIYARRQLLTGNKPDTEVLGVTIADNVVVRCGGNPLGGIVANNEDSVDRHGAYLVIASNVVDDHKTVFRSLVDRAGSSVTWRAGDYFATNWSGTVRINGMDRTISSVPNAKAITLSGSPGGTETDVVLERENLTEGNTFMAGIWIKGCYNITDVPNQVDPPKGIVIASNVVRCTKRNIETGWGIIIEQASECIVQGNYMANAKTGGILCLGCDKSIFTGNSYPEGIVVKFEDSSSSRIDPDHLDNVVIGNIGDSISVPNSSDRLKSIFLGNRLLGSGTAPISGSGSPTANAAYVGQDYVQTGTPTWHKAKSVGSGSSDWVAL